MRKKYSVFSHTWNYSYIGSFASSQPPSKCRATYSFMMVFLPGLKLFFPPNQFWYSFSKIRTIKESRDKWWIKMWKISCKKFLQFFTFQKLNYKMLYQRVHEKLFLKENQLLHHMAKKEFSEDNQFPLKKFQIVCLKINKKIKKIWLTHLIWENWQSLRNSFHVIRYSSWSFFENSFSKYPLK